MASKKGVVTQYSVGYGAGPKFKLRGATETFGFARDNPERPGYHDMILVSMTNEIELQVWYNTPIHLRDMQLKH